MIGLRKVYKTPLTKIYDNPNMFVKLIDIMPRVSENTTSSLIINCDAAIAEAARVSYGKGTKTVNEDKDLIKYLVRHKHTSPFEMVEFKFHLAMPIFIQRQWIRHRTANVNEISGRYSEFDHNFYHPKVLLGQSKLNKQVSCDVLDNSTENIDKMKEHSNKSFELYKELLNAGVSREIARTVLPQNLITEFYWKIDLHNLLHFIRLRDHPHAQTEIRQYAGDIKQMVKKFCPISVEAYDNHFVKGVHLSGDDIELLKTYSKTGVLSKPYSMSKGELREFKGKLKQLGLSYKNNPFTRTISRSSPTVGVSSIDTAEPNYGSGFFIP